MGLSDYFIYLTEYNRVKSTVAKGHAKSRKSLTLEHNGRLLTRLDREFRVNCRLWPAEGH